MFGRSAPSSQPDLFSSFELHFNRRKQRQLNDPKSWHNLFYEHVTSKVDEDLYSVLHDANQDPPRRPDTTAGVDVDPEGGFWMERCATVRALSIQHPGDARIGDDESMR